MKYTAEEVRAVAKRLHDDITVMDSDALAASDMLTAYAERIAADEGAVTNGVIRRAAIAYRANDTMMRGWQPDSRDLDRMRDALLAVWPSPPAQAAQVESMPEIRAWLADYADELDEQGSTDVAATIRATVASLTGAPAAEPVAHDEDVERACDNYEAYWDGAHSEPVAQGEAVIDAKYDNVLVPFARLMVKELHANAGKGDRPGWLSMAPAVGMLEIYYHAAKLQKSVKDGNGDGIREYAADVANMAMMLLDVCSGLAVTDSAQPGEPAAKREAVAFRYRFRDGHGRWLGWHYSNRPPRTFVEGDNLQGEPLFNAPPAQPAELPEFLKDPANVHVMMLRGAIAIPSIRSMVDLRGEVPNGEDAQLARIAELQEQVAALEAQPAERVVEGMDAAELAEFAKTIAEFNDCEMTETPHHVLMRWAEMGLLVCEYFELTKKGQDLLTAAQEADR